MICDNCPVEGSRTAIGVEVEAESAVEEVGTEERRRNIGVEVLEEVCETDRGSEIPIGAEGS